ncbi:D-3-phosphoglycerate dehydrogenase/(S)-sulfolactate dehydrogenase [Caldalkalibacillus uzonensis]|uniref:D-3-phosphoglycerate dehydrogenase/(S)-sulfolactate dehydrogenase n=1 Tax=Caldalkalibacillus uzonensis TaxID=353224 RepID=A0ABU0CPX6_9BACI|nr:hydroxyacid dehydrogenase [Caldalkalibacillus uzonensis]MDQ0337954.1 D-3-phosphoglycerate dehydrogenase/(S)-sulfolactate dehydrogenase [Caldalkalibacillus uzonensis]
MKVVIAELNWPEGIRLLRQEAKVVYNPDLWKDREKLFSEIKDADALIVRNQTQVDRQLLAHASRLKVVGRLGVGLDNIDIGAAKEADVSVVYAKNANAISVAEYVIAGLLTVCRPLLAATEAVKQGQWNRRCFTGSEIYGRTLGLIGVGEIGLRIAVRAQALGLKVVGYDPFVGPYDYPYAEAGIKKVSFEDVLAHSDFISIHVPLTPQTRDMISHAEFSKMKPTVTMINTSRGGVVDEQALSTFLNHHHQAFGILDVLEQEPPQQDHPLFALDNVILTPHVAGLTEQSQERTSRLVAEEVLKELRGQPSICSIR